MNVGDTVRFTGGDYEGHIGEIRRISQTINGRMLTVFNGFEEVQASEHDVVVTGGTVVNMGSVV